MVVCTSGPFLAVIASPCGLSLWTSVSSVVEKNLYYKGAQGFTGKTIRAA
jgi:hypothetical protein